MKKVMIVIPSLRGGGAERVASQLANYLEDQFDVVTVVFNNENPKYKINGELIDLQTASQKSVVGKLKLFAKRYKSLKKIKKELDIDVSISFLSSPNMLNILSHCGEMSIVSIRNYPSREEIGKIDKFVENRLTKLYQKADCIVPVSKAIEEDVVTTKHVSRNKIKTIYNPIDSKLIYSQSQEAIQETTSAVENTFKFVTVGNLRKVKGHYRLISIFSELVKINPNVSLSIVGEGPERERLEELIQAKNLQNHVFLLGYQANPYKYVNQSDVFLLSSYSEGFPNSVLEAMVLKKPIIATNCLSGPLEILSDDLTISVKNDNYFKADYGLLSPAFSQDHDDENLNSEEKAYLQAMIDLINDEEMYDVYCKLSEVRAKNFEIDKIVNEWVMLINDLVHN